MQDKNKEHNRSVKQIQCIYHNVSLSHIKKTMRELNWEFRYWVKQFIQVKQGKKDKKFIKVIVTNFFSSVL